jgi:hypothetical protein
MIQDDQRISEERDLDEAAHEQLKDDEPKPLAPTTQEEIIEQEHDLDEEAHRQLEDDPNN